MNGAAGHLWQTLLCVLLISFFAWLTRGNSALLRLWLWRAAAFKLLVPFALLAAVGRWHGFPVRFAGDPPPAAMVALVDRVAPWLSPGSWFTAMWAKLLLLLVLLLAAAVMARRIFASIHVESGLANLEQQRLALSPDDREPSVGFVRAALITACALLVISLPLLGGAIRGSAHEHQILVANTRSLTDAKVILRPARAGLGSRFFLDVRPRGVQIRNISVHELTALAYGVNRFFVRGEHYRGSGEDWLIDARYDVHIDAPVIEPGNFDSYALRPAITRELATNFGLEIYVNSECQKPCGKWGGRVLLQVAPDSWALVDGVQPEDMAKVAITATQPKSREMNGHSR
jgi:hypothetical protein